MPVIKLSSNVMMPSGMAGPTLGDFPWLCNFGFRSSEGSPEKQKREREGEGEGGRERLI